MIAKALVSRTALLTTQRAMFSGLAFHTHVPREASGEKGEPLTIRKLHELGQINL